MKNEQQSAAPESIEERIERKLRELDATIDKYGKAESEAPESQPKQGCCAARKALKRIRERLGIAILGSPGAPISWNEEIALLDQALAAPCECERLRAEFKNSLTAYRQAVEVCDRLGMDNARLREEVKQLQTAVELHKGTADGLRAQLAATKDDYEAERGFIEKIESMVGANCRGSLGTGISEAVNRLKSEHSTAIQESRKLSRQLAAKDELLVEAREALGPLRAHNEIMVREGYARDWFQASDFEPMRELLAKLDPAKQP